MHDHNNDNNGHKSMMWMMLICCLLPVIVLFGGLEFFRSIGYNWLGLGLIGIIVIIHFSKMWLKNRGHNLNNQDMENYDNKKGHDNCCH